MELSGEYTDDKINWQGLKAGNRTCFNWLFKKYYSELYYYGIKILPDRDLIKESIQEVFMRIWETRENLSFVENVKSYLIVSVKRMILLQNGKKRGSGNIEIGSAENYSFYFDINEFEKHEELPEELRKVILTAINSLTRKQRELIMLFFYHELSYAEIADILEISVQAARNLMYRTLLHLREILGERSINSMKSMFFLLFSDIVKKKTE
jgi:RNA polymerase sigma-70 factor (ECF subfamily)